VRAVEHKLVERSFILDECGALRDRVGTLEVQVHTLLTLSTQLSSLAAQLVDLKTELAGFRGRAVGVVAVVTFIAPLVASALTAFVVKIFKLG
jgi:hypothetical protein